MAPIINRVVKSEAMNKLIFRVRLKTLASATVMVGLLFLLALPAGAHGSPTLTEGHVTPENQPWGSTFTFEVTYTDNDNNLPSVGPKLYIDNKLVENAMAEKDPADNDVTDGKNYEYAWATTAENVGAHDFYFYAESPLGENARDPSTGTHEGPRVDKRSVFLSCVVDNPEPAAGETVTFSGYLRTTEENLGVAAENLILYKLLSGGDVSVGSTTTDENGHFSLSLDAPDPGIFCYEVRFLGDNFYENSESSNLYVNTIEKPMVLGIYAAVLLTLVGVMIFLLTRGIARAHYLWPVLLGFLLGFFLVEFMGAADIGILAAGAIAGYLFARVAREWTRHFRIGCTTGLLLLLVLGFLFAYLTVFYLMQLLNELPELSPAYSITQTEMLGNLFFTTVLSLVYYSMLAGMGAVLGGMLRKLLKPAETKP